MAVYSVILVGLIVIISSMEGTLPLQLSNQVQGKNQRLETSRISSLSVRFKALLFKKFVSNEPGFPEDSKAEDSTKSFKRYRRDFNLKRLCAEGRYQGDRDDEDKMKYTWDDRYECSLLLSLRTIGYIQPTRLFVPEDARLVPVGTVIGKVQKLHPHGKVVIVWPHNAFRNFTVNEDTGEVKTTALMDFELIRSYRMIIRDFHYDYSDAEPRKQPPKPVPEESAYIDHYLIVEVVDLNDNSPKFEKDTGVGGGYQGRVNKNARAGTPILRVHATDDDSGPRGRIRFDIQVDGVEENPFTIDPETHMLKTNGKSLKTKRYMVKVVAYDYGMPPKSSGVQLVSVDVGKTPPEFIGVSGVSYNLNFSEASVRGSVVAKVTAVSKSDMPMAYEIVEKEAGKTFAINDLGQITLLRELDFENANETDKVFEFTVKGREDAIEGQVKTVRVNLNLANADDHLGMFKTPATKIRLKEGSLPKVFTVEVEDCDCQKNCLCGSNEMIFTLGDTNGFFDITKDGQIRNIKNLDYETQNYFFFPVNVTDPGTNGRTRTSYIEVYVDDDDDTPPKFPVNTYEFFIFEDAPKGQVVGVAQAVDPDPSTQPDDVQYSIISATPSSTREYFAVGNQGVIKVNDNKDQFGKQDKYELEIQATDKFRSVSDPPATVIIRILDVNDNQPVFTKCESQTIKENQDIGTVLTILIATDNDRGFNKLIEYSIQHVQKYNFFAIDKKTGVVTTTHVLDREQYDNIFVVAKATDGGSRRSDALRQIGYCQFIVNVEDVNDHHPEFTVATFDVTIQRTLGTTKEVLLVEAVDPDVGDNANINYRIKSQKKNRVQKVDYFTVHSTTGSLKVKNPLTRLSLSDKISVVIEAYNKVAVVGSPIAGAKTKTTVIVSFTNKEPLKFGKTKYTVNGVKESIGAGKPVLTLNVLGSRKALYSLQTEIRDRDDIPFTLDAGSGNIRTSKTLDYELKKSYVFAVTAAPLGENILSSAIIQINIQDVDDVVPIFGNDKYQATVSEAAKPDVNVFRIKATDPDPSSGGPMVYVVRPLHDYKVFQVVKVKDYAQIKTAKNLRNGFFDREKKDLYTIIIDAYREKAPGLRGTAYVSIHVRDENDSPPVFQKKLYKASVPEGTKVPYTVPGITLMARDNDILENANVSYFITSGNDGRFEMRTIYHRDQYNTGKLVVVRPLDVEKTPKFQKNPVYNLTVTATDRKHTDTTTITIEVLDRPETRPEFIEDYYEKYLPENVGPGVNVVQVQVKKQRNVEFSLDDKAKPYFAINRLNGWITTAGELLDWEKTPVITFPVYAFEKNYPEEKGQTFVRVIVNDVNDAPPYFPDQPYIGYIRENVLAGATVRYVNGKDLDDPDVNSGNNVKLTYELLTNTGQDPYDKDGQLFTFNSQGLLVTKVTFDLEKYRRNLTVRVRAWDNGNPKLYGETDVTIVIQDVNEYPARFQKREYEASVSETQPPGFVVLQLTVTDSDFAPRDNYAFSIIKGNKPYAFDILQDTGEIVVAGVLDYDKYYKKKNLYELEIGLNERNDNFRMKGDGGNTKAAVHIDKAKVVITVTAGNDNRPTFGNKEKIYKVTVPENIKVGTALNVAPVIEATDADKGFSNQFDFRITKGNRGDWFGIRKDSKDSNKAVVFMQYPIDREYKSVYDMEIIVKDKGGVFDTARLIVTVTDINDNPPVFHPSNYKATIKENDCKDNKPLVTLSVTDPDLPEKQKFKLEFAQNGNPGDRFRLTTTTDNTTALTCQKSINREETPNVKVIIKATDEGTPRLSSTAIVFIEVEDVDEFSPKNGKLRIIVNAVEGDFDGGLIGKTYFEDKDGDGDRNMVYTLTGSEEFAIKKSNGWISAKSTVKVGKYQLRVTGRKSSGSLVSCDVDVDVRNLPKEAIQDSAAFQLKDVWNENRLLNPVRIDDSAGYEDLTYYDKFVDMLSDMFDVVKDNVFVFNIQMATKVMPGRQTPALDVRFAIRKDSSVKSKFLPRYVLINTLEKNKKTLQDLGFKLGMIGIDYCVNESMRVGMCNNVVERKGKSYSVVSSDYGLMPAPKYAVALVSIDTTVNGVYSRYKEIPDPEFDTCDPQACLNGGTCHDVVPGGFVCECPAEYSGPRCQLTTRTFLGDSYIWLRPKTPYNYGSISLEFATGAASGLLLYQGPAVKGGNNGHGDFLAISLVNGKIKIGLSFGGKPLAFTFEKSSRLDDKKWHHVEVSHQRKDVTVIIDHCKHADVVEDDEKIVEKRENCEIITKTTENFEYLNGLGPIQVGGVENMPLDYPSSEFVQYTYFSGCIRKIQDNREMYDLGYPLKVVNAPVGCTVMAKCPTCLNGGYCFPGFSRSVCTCPMGYVGDDCSRNAPRYSYLPNSFTEYVLPGEERRRKRGAAQEPSDLLDRYTVHISMQIRLDQGVKKAIFFYALSEDDMEYSLLGYEDQKLYFEFKLLDGVTRLEMPGMVEIHDRNWHNVTVTREGNFAVLQVDYKGRVSSNTGGAKKLLKTGSSKLYIGGMPNFAPNANSSTVNKIVEAAVTDHRYRRSMGKSLNLTTDNRLVSSVSGDMRGCIASMFYNGKNLDADTNVKKVRFNTKPGCPCIEILSCSNGGTCVSGYIPYCQCPRGWSGKTCENIGSDGYTPSDLATSFTTSASSKPGQKLLTIC